MTNAMEILRATAFGEKHPELCEELGFLTYYKIGKKRYVKAVQYDFDFAISRPFKGKTKHHLITLPKFMKKLCGC